MSLKSSQITEPKGFALLLKNILSPLEKKNGFSETFKGKRRTFLINPTNLEYAGIVILNDGQLTFKAIRNKKKEHLKKSNVGWDAYLAMNSRVLLALIMKRLSYLKLGLKWIFGNVKLRGLLSLLTLRKMINFLYK
ncbi:MAG: hypothetical protein ACOC4M_04245 [Promethearchaeia archaeon]